MICLTILDNRRKTARTQPKTGLNGLVIRSEQNHGKKFPACQDVCLLGKEGTVINPANDGYTIVDRITLKMLLKTRKKSPQIYGVINTVRLLCQIKGAA